MKLKKILSQSWWIILLKSGRLFFEVQPLYFGMGLSNNKKFSWIASLFVQPSEGFKQAESNHKDGEGEQSTPIFQAICSLGIYL